MTYISCFSDFAFYFYYYFMENCHTWIIISMWQNDLHTNTSRSVWPILYGWMISPLLENYFIDYFILIFLMIKMLQYKMYPAGELRCPTTALVFHFFHIFNLDFFHASILWKCICSRYLVSATPPTVFDRSFWNSTGVLIMVWRFACAFYRILKLFFFTFLT